MKEQVGRTAYMSIKSQLQFSNRLMKNQMLQIIPAKIKGPSEAVHVDRDSDLENLLLEKSQHFYWIARGLQAFHLHV